MLIDIIKPILENPIFIKYGIVSLFFNSVLAGIIPFPTEITSSALLLAGQNPMLIFLILGIGSSIGGIISYYVGFDGNKMILKLMHKTKKKEHYEKGIILLAKYGWEIIAVSSWIPILGDIVTLIAGVRRYDFKKFVISMIVGKITHAMAIVYFSNLFFHFFNYF